MEERKAYNLKWVMLIYNLYQTVFNAWLFIMMLEYVWKATSCAPYRYFNVHFTDISARHIERFHIL